MYVLDSDHISILQRATGDAYARLERRLLACAPSDIYWTIISLHEQFNGWHAYLQRSQRPTELVYGYHRLQALLTSFSSINVLSFDQAAVDIFSQLRRHRLSVGTMDLRIAAIAIARDFTLLTTNYVDFSRVPGLRSADWTLP